MAVENADLVLLDYSAKTGGVLFDTTSRAEAEKAGSVNPDGKYGPVLVAVGKHQVIPGLEEALLGVEAQNQKTVTLPPEKAFGVRKPELVRLVPLQQFLDQRIEPVAGMVLELDGQPARIQSVSGGRVRVDFNPDLAGKQVEYAFTVLKIFKTAEEKVKALGEDAGFSADFASGVAKATLSGDEKSAADLAVKKLRFLSACFHLVDGVQSVKFDESYVHGTHD